MEWRPDTVPLAAVEDAENSNMSGTVDWTQASDPVNWAGMWEFLQVFASYRHVLTSRLMLLSLSW